MIPQGKILLCIYNTYGHTLSRVYYGLADAFIRKADYVFLGDDDRIPEFSEKDCVQAWIDKLKVAGFVDLVEAFGQPKFVGVDWARSDSVE